MSDLDLAAIKARCAAATPGPWRLSRSEEIICGDDMYLIDGGGIAPSDAEFIAAARTDVPALVAEVVRLREERDDQASLVEVFEDEAKRLRSDLASCYRITGADPDGDDDAMLARKAVNAVRRLREESDHQGTRADEFAEEVKKMAGERDAAHAAIELIKTDRRLPRRSRRGERCEPVHDPRTPRPALEGRCGVRKPVQNDLAKFNDLMDENRRLRRDARLYRKMLRTLSAWLKLTDRDLELDLTAAKHIDAALAPRRRKK